MRFLPAMDAIIAVVIVVGLLLTVAWLAIRVVRRRARRMGYPRLLIYLRATPRDGAEKRDAVDLFAMGLALTILGIIFHPLVIIGLVPLYYGCRKIGDVILGVERSRTENTHTDQPGAMK